MRKDKGFEIAFDYTTHIARIRAWGFWDEQLAEQFREKFAVQARTINQGKDTWNFLIDLTDYPPQLPETQNVIGEGLARLEPYKIQKRAVLINGTITRLRTENLTRRANVHVFYSYFRTEEDAVRWLLNDTNHTGIEAEKKSAINAS